MDYGDAAPEPSNPLLRAENISRLSEYLGDEENRGSYSPEEREPEREKAAPVNLTLEEELLEQVNFTFPICSSGRSPYFSSARSTAAAI